MLYTPSCTLQRVGVDNLRERSEQLLGAAVPLGASAREKNFRPAMPTESAMYIDPEPETEPSVPMQRMFEARLRLRVPHVEPPEADIGSLPPPELLPDGVEERDLYHSPRDAMTIAREAARRWNEQEGNFFEAEPTIRMRVWHANLPVSLPHEKTVEKSYPIHLADSEFDAPGR